MKFLIDYFTRYIVIRKRVDKQSTIKSVIFSTLLGLLVTAIIIVPLIIIVSNLMIYTKYQIYLTIFIALIIMASIILYQIVFYKLLGYFVPYIKNIQTNIIVITESIIINLIILVLAVIVIIGLFGGNL